MLPDSELPAAGLPSVTVVMLTPGQSIVPEIDVTPLVASVAE